MSIILIENFLAKPLCENLIETAEKIGFSSIASSYEPGHRNNERLTYNDENLAKQLFDKIKPFVPEKQLRDKEIYNIKNINPCFRLCRYKPNQKCGSHMDAVYQPDAKTQSFYTFMIYLNDVDTKTAGGATRFFKIENWKEEIESEVEPKQGLLIVFPHELLHDGQELQKGIKYILRSEIVYQKE